MNLSQNIEDYLKAIFLLSKGESASTKDIATRLKVSPASVTNMLKKLSELKLVEYESYRGVSLTHAGRKIALEVLRHHRLIETYLAEALGYDWDEVRDETERLIGSWTPWHDWDEVHDEAERREHHMSEEFEDRIAKLLGDPQYDPHGDPIPTKDGRMPPVSRDRLADADEGETVTVRRVGSDDTPTLRFLKENGIRLGTSLRVAKRDEDAGVITVRIKRASVDLTHDMCKNIYIERLNA